MMPSETICYILYEWKKLCIYIIIFKNLLKKYNGRCLGFYYIKV